MNKIKIGEHSQVVKGNNTLGFASGIIRLISVAPLEPKDSYTLRSDHFY